MRRDPTEGVGMSAMAQAQFDIEALKVAFEAREAGKVLEFYSSDLEHIEIDAGAPPNSPRKSGTEYIGNAIEGAGQAGITLHMENPVVARTGRPARSPVSFLTAGAWSPTRSTT